ncbi:ribose transport system substrate-binding protein [Kribbella amoyensis]|uniref:Ribose transport system substrate-binding protein n=1 Tax=Kribbella amoyensis TaxID=996641 RepID=A0A561B8A7_9ACTN|nr:sugar ABC transporter substrate-binding protein [Kribbella amoyensis]TWD75195.1 ribose transport system substrate-binding protein [Kribbella amoyensis]
MTGKRRIPLAALVVALAAAGCGQATDTSSAPADAAPDAKNLTIGVSNLGKNFPFPAAIVGGIDEKAKELGVKLVQVDAQGTAEKQANDVQDLIGQKPSGVLLLPVDSGVATGLADQLKTAGIPTVAVASQVGDPAGRKIEDVYPGLVALVTQAEVKAGRIAGELAVEALPSGGKVAIVEGTAGFAEVKTRSAEFLAPAQAKGVDLTVVARQPGDWVPDKAQSACQNILAAHPDVALIYNQSDDMAVGCSKAVKAAGSKAKVIGVGGSKLGVEGVSGGDIYGTVCYKPKDMGALALQVLYDQLTGAKKRDAEFVTYDTPGITKANVADCAPQW